MAGEEADGGLVDARRQHLLGAALRSATRPRFLPSAANTLPAAAPAGGNWFGASASIALMRWTNPGVAEGRGVGNRTLSGRASRASHMLMRKRCGSGRTKASTWRSSRSASGR